MSSSHATKHNMQNINSTCQNFFELSGHIKNVDRQTDRRMDRKGDYYRALSQTDLSQDQGPVICDLGFSLFAQAQHFKQNIANT